MTIPNPHYNCGFKFYRSVCPTGEHVMAPVWAPESTLRALWQAWAISPRVGYSTAMRGDYSTHR